MELLQEIKRNKWKFPLTTTRWVLIIIALIGMTVMIYRLATGLGTTTALNDQWPWGLWIAFDVMCGVALAGGGYGTALIVYVLNRKKYYPIARAALLTSLLGYVVVAIGLLMDIGQWFNFWRPFTSWGYTSVLFEVFICVTCYTLVQILEFGEIVTEKVGRKYHGYFKKALPPLLIIGIIFPTLHQSSLGGLYLIMVDKLYPLWWSPLLPFFFLLSSFFVGPAMICLEGALAQRSFNHRVPGSVYRGLVRISGGAMVLYLVLRVYDLFQRGVFPLLLRGNVETYLFLVEIIVGVMVPVIIAFSNLSANRSGLLAFGIFTSFGVVLSRINVVFTGMHRSVGGSYFPSPGEFSITLGLIAIAVLLYIFVVENFNIFGEEKKDYHQYDHWRELVE